MSRTERFAWGPLVPFATWAAMVACIVIVSLTA